MAGGVAARTAAAELTWATAALGLPGPLLGMVSLMSNSTPPGCDSRRLLLACCVLLLAADCESCRIITQVGALQLSRTLSESLRVAI